MPDGCGGTVTCRGSCNGNRVCGAAGANVCAKGSCTPTTCAQQGKTCGLISDGCSRVLDCGTCGNGMTCVANVST